MFLTKHLAVLGECFAAEVPGGDMVGFHVDQFEALVAFRTDALLALVGFVLFGFIKQFWRHWKASPFPVGGKRPLALYYRKGEGPPTATLRCGVHVRYAAGYPSALAGCYAIPLRYASGMLRDPPFSPRK